MANKNIRHLVVHVSGDKHDIRAIQKRLADWLDCDIGVFRTVHFMEQHETEPRITRNSDNGA